MYRLYMNLWVQYFLHLLSEGEQVLAVLNVHLKRHHYASLNTMQRSGSGLCTRFNSIERLISVLLLKVMVCYVLSCLICDC